MPDLFYAKHSDINSPPSVSPLDSRFLFDIWRPTPTRIVPSGIPIVPFAAWWLCHYLRLFSNRDYAVMLVRDDGKIVHRSGVFPKYFRFPFMAVDDLQIGDTWTLPEYRGQGLATFALRTITETFHKPGRTFWYVTEQENSTSISVVEKVGFEMVGVGNRTKRFGIRALGAYVIQQPITPHE